VLNLHHREQQADPEDSYDYKKKHKTKFVHVMTWTPTFTYLHLISVQNLGHLVKQQSEK